jgi:hypothetical protein
MKNTLIYILLLAMGMHTNLGHPQSLSMLAASALNPLSLALTVGQWIMKGSQRVYFIQVEASAQNIVLAKQEGLRLAVNQAVGTLVLAESKIQNQELIRQDLTLYSSGYVEEFKILSEEKVGDQTRLVMDVWVAESKIANRLFALSKGEGVIDGSQVATQYQSILEERYQGDRVIQLVANDFPQKAFTVNMGKLSWRMVGRDAEILVPAELAWNKDYMEAMYAALVQTRNGNQAANQRYQKNWPAVVAIKRPSDWFTTYASYADTKKVALLKERMILSLPTVQILIKNLEGHILYSTCASIPHLSGAFHGESLAFGVYPSEKFGYPTGQFFAAHSPDADFSIYGDFKVNTIFRLPMQVNPKFLSTMQAIEINVVPKDQCQKKGIHHA